MSRFASCSLQPARCAPASVAWRIRRLLQQTCRDAGERQPKILMQRRGKKKRSSLIGFSMFNVCCRSIWTLWSQNLHALFTIQKIGAKWGIGRSRPEIHSILRSLDVASGKLEMGSCCDSNTESPLRLRMDLKKNAVIDVKL